MTTNRLAAGILSLVLSGLLGWSIVAGVGDARTQITLGIGIALGVVYIVYGRVPNWIVNYSGGSLTDDDDPANISPGLYLPILLSVVLVAAIAFIVLVFVM